MQTWSRPKQTPTSERAGVRFGPVGAHTSRTMMLAELADLLEAVPARPVHRGAEAMSATLSATPPPAPSLPPGSLPSRADYLRAVLEDNALGKGTAASRRITLQRLSELYGLDPMLGAFRVLRRLWEIDPPGRPLLALLCALARDPLLRATADVVLPLVVGAELPRVAMLEALAGADDLRDAAGSQTETRFNAAILDKVARNAASSWAQSGHLHGRVRKVRRAVAPTPGSAAFALWLGSLEGLAGDYLLTTLWAAALDATPNRLFDCALEAKQLGLLRVVAGGGVREIDVSGLDPAENR
ncbi:MAG TPA: hypothetical protein VFZ65_02645 [Planctomycetota bacterium]|nr:hypothetical protein [Planctomycetota bacterium]